MLSGRHWWQFGAVVTVNKVTLRWARLVLGWVTGPGFNSRYRKLILLYNQPPRQTQPGHPSADRHSEYQPYGSKSKAGVVCLWVAGKTV